MRPSQKPRIILIILIALCGLFVYSYTSRLAEKSHLNAEIMAVQARIDAAKTEQLELQEELAYISQPDYINEAARVQFNSVKPGDRVLVIVDKPVAKADAAMESLTAVASANPIDYRNFPVWQQWVVLFTTDSFRLSTQ